MQNPEMLKFWESVRKCNEKEQRMDALLNGKGQLVWDIVKLLMSWYWMQGLEVLKSESVSMLDCNESKWTKTKGSSPKSSWHRSLCALLHFALSSLLYTPATPAPVLLPPAAAPSTRPANLVLPGRVYSTPPLFSLPLPASLVHSCNTPQTVLLILFLSRHDRILLLISFISMLFQSYLLP